MKSIKFLLLAFVFASMFASCNNKKANYDNVVIKEAELAISNKDMSILDSIAEDIKNTEDKNLSTCFSVGTYVLKDYQKKVKPGYLMPLSSVNKASNNIDRVRMLAVLVAERNICRAFEMPYESYNELISKLSNDLDFPIYSKGLTDISESESIMKEKETVAMQYQSMKSNGTDELFWAYEQTAQIEFFYLLSCDPDIYLSLLTDEVVDINCKRATRLLQAQEIMATYFENIKQINQLQFAAKELNKTTPTTSPTLKDLKEFLISNHDQIAQVRNKMLGL